VDYLARRWPFDSLLAILRRLIFTTIFVGAYMSQHDPIKRILSNAIVAVAAIGYQAHAQTAMAPVNDAPNPYETIESYFKLPEGRKWGATSAVDIDKDGKSIWVGERCGANSCLTSPDVDPMLHFDAKGNLIRSFGKGMIIFPHGIHVDRQGNVWITDGQDNAPRPPAAAPGAPPRPPVTGPSSEATKGHQVFKFSPKGKLLLTIGKPGGATGPAECCWQPNDVITNKKGEIFISEGHGANQNDRIMKFSKDGKFLQAWGTRGSGPMQFNQPHGLAFDSKENLYVADRSNNRVLVFDKDMKQIADWPQFSRPSGIYIDRNDVLYSADSESGSINPAHGDWKRGIRIGSVKDGKVTAFIPDPLPTCERGTQPGNPPTCGGGTWVAEGVAVDKAGNIYGAEVGPRKLQKYVKK
jgi:DNA-binding beta-propeller fold protein YncE